MKTITIRLLALCALAVMLLPGLSSAQSISINSVSATTFCGGDRISVTFTASGTWGHKNAFTLQLSDETGSFSNTFSNIGSISDTIPGTFTLVSTLPDIQLPSAHYRFRIISANPYTASTDNGSGIYIGKVPDEFLLGSSTPSVYIYAPVNFFILNRGGPDKDDTIYWDFGADATPQTYVSNTASAWNLNASYSTGGEKTIKVRMIAQGGCLRDYSFKLKVIDTSYNASYCFPAIPKTALIDSSSSQDFTYYDFGKVVWINPGVTSSYSQNIEYDTVFCEPGASIINHNKGNVYYLKSGVSYRENSSDGNSNNTIIHADGVSIQNTNSSDVIISCPGLTFDYTNAPLNKAFQGDVKRNISSNQIELSPNPTTGNITVHGLPLVTQNISIMSILGNTVMQIPPVYSESFTVSISKLPQGTYYLRIVSNNGVVTKKIIKE